jgi:hypothetical protein
MNALMKWQALVFTWVWLAPAVHHAQQPSMHDPVFRIALRAVSGGKPLPYNFRADQGLEYSVSGSGLVALNQLQVRNLYQVNLLQHARLQLQLKNEREVKMVGTFVHNLGIRYIVDSLFQFEPDENTLETRLDVPLGTKFSVAFTSCLFTRIFNSYRYSVDPAGNRFMNLESAFFSPLVWTFSGGIALNFPQFATVTLGLSSGKMTWIMNRDVYGQDGTTVVCGVPRDKNYLFEYGYGLHLRVDRDLASRVHWNCDLQLFKNYRKPPDLAFDNLVGIRIGRFVKTSILTKVSYDREVSRCVRVENRLTIGFFISL